MKRASVLILWVTYLSLVLTAASDVSRVSSAIPETVPFDDGISRLRQLTEEEPERADAYLIMGNAYSYAYAFDSKCIPNPERTLAAMDSLPRVPVSPASLLLPVSSQRLQYLAESVRMHQKAVELARGNPVAWMGLGYACAEAAKRCATSDWPKDDFAFTAQRDYDKEAPRYWEGQALAAYRKARELAPPGEKEDDDNLDRRYPSSTQSDWAALGIVQVYGRRTSLSPEEEQEALSLLNSALRAAREISIRIDPERFHYASDVPSWKLDEARGLFPDVPLERNGAEYFLHAASACTACDELDYETLQKLPIIGDLELALPPAPLSDEVLILVEQQLQYDQESLRLAHQAASFTQFAFPRDFRAGMAQSLSYLGPMRALGRILALQALYQAEKAQPATAAQSLCDVFTLSRSLTGEPGEVPQLVSFAIARIGLNNLEQVINRTTLDESDLFSLQQAIAAIDTRKSINNACQGEKWLFGSMELSDEKVRQDVILKKRMRLGKASSGGNGIDVNDAAFIEDVEADPVFTQDVEVSDEELQAAREEMLAELRTLQRENATVCDQIMALIQSSFSALYEKVKMPDDFKPGDYVPSPFGTRHVPGLGAFCIATVRSEASLRVAQTALAIERYRQHHGELPDTLEEVAEYCVSAEALIDPFNDEHLNYDVNDERFVVYSVADRMINEKPRYRKSDAPSAISFTVYR